MAGSGSNTSPTDRLNHPFGEIDMSIVRDNLMTRPGYTPYCGDEKCALRMPRTRFNGSQFVCGCGWQSQFDPEFIAKYKARWADAPSPAEERAWMEREYRHAGERLS
jgi:hypothetical protein